MEDKILVVAVKEEHQDLKIMDMSIDLFLTMYYGFSYVYSSQEDDSRVLTDDEKFTLEEVLNGNIQFTRDDSNIKVMLKKPFPIKEYLDNIYVR